MSEEVNKKPEETEETKAPEENKAPEEAEEAKAPEESAEEKVDEMEKETLYELQLYREDGNEANDEAVSDAEKALKKIFADLREWLQKNGDPEVVKARLQKAAEDANGILQSTKQKVIEVSESEQFKKTMEAGKDFILGTGGMLADGVKYTADQLMKNPTINKVVTDVDGKLDTLRESKVLKDVVDKTEDVVDKATSALFNGLKSFFDKPEKKAEPEKKPELPAVEEKPEEDGKDS